MQTGSTASRDAITIANLKSLRRFKECKTRLLCLDAVVGGGGCCCCYYYCYQNHHYYYYH